MADENTTGSEATTTTENPVVVETTPPADTSTTETPSSTETLLTGKAPEEKEVEQTDEQKAAAAEHAKLFGAPEGDYEISGLPEGMTVDTEALAAFAPLAKELGLSNEGMSKVAVAYAEILPQVTDRVVANLQNDIAAQHSAWATEAIELVKTDPLFGGRPLGEVQQLAAKAIDRLGDPEFRKYLDDTGLGNHPAMMRFAFNAGSAISEDTSFERGNNVPAAKTRTDKYYGPQT